MSKIHYLWQFKTNLTMTIAQKQFLELLRSGLWGKPADASLFEGDVDWKAILRIAHQQTVSVHVADGIETLPPALCPSKTRIFKLAIRRTENTLMHKLLNTTINHIVRALNAEGIPSVLLKGQGVAQNYRHPESRMCGDIDLYVGEGNYRKACEIIAGLSTSGNAMGLETDMHQHLTLNDAEIEVHKMADCMNTSKQQRILESWIGSIMDMSAIPATSNSWNNDGTEICIPPHTYNAFYILHHGVRHLASDGLGLRQVCDWAMYLNAHHSDIDAEALKEKLRIFKMDEIWNVFSQLVTDFLGFPEDKLPIPIKGNPTKKANLLIKQIFYTGNFGQYAAKKIDTQEKKVIKRKWRNFLVESSRLFILFKISPKFTVPHTFGWFTRAIGRLFEKR